MAVFSSGPPTCILGPKAVEGNMNVKLLTHLLSWVDWFG